MNDDDAPIWLFAYGTLRDPAVRVTVLGREPVTEADALWGFRLDRIVIGGQTCRTLVPSERPDGAIEGLALRLTADELARVDAYEGDTDYVRLPVRLESGRAAFVYVSATA